MSEFSLIQKYFQSLTPELLNVPLGIGDDAAIVNVPEQQQLVVCVDTIVAGQHFLLDTPAAAIGHRALAVNLSDIAAMAAIPRWFTLALTLPQENPQWLAEFSQGLQALAAQYQVQLIGGDTSQGPLSITIQVLGTIPPNTAITRQGARVGDKIYVTGTLGDAGFGLEICRLGTANKDIDHMYLAQRYQYPEPRVVVGQQLRGIADSLIDISDGLAADLQHVLERSHVGAILYTQDLPLSAALCRQVGKEAAVQYALTAGDDYELCFTVPAAQQAKITDMANEMDITFTCIGEIVNQTGLQIYAEDGKLLNLDKKGWEFF